MMVENIIKPIFNNKPSKYQMKNILAFLFLSIASGCASFEKTQAGLDTLIGKDIQVAFHLIGYPTIKQEFAGDLVYSWSVNRSGTIILPQTSFVSGSVGTTPVYGTVTTSSPVPFNAVCTIKIITNKNGIIKAREINGNYAGCSQYMTVLSEYADITTQSKSDEARIYIDYRSKDVALFDEQVESMINNGPLAKDPYANLKVAVFNKRALIAGELTNSNDKVTVLDIVKNTMGIIDVMDEIELIQDQGPYIQGIDGVIKSTLAYKISQDTDLGHLTHKVIVAKGKVYLLGIMSKKHGQEIAEIASRIRGVIRVTKLFEYTSK